jgi:hypothetical protein
MFHTTGDEVDIVELQILEVVCEPLGVWGVEKAAEAKLGIPHFLARFRHDTSLCRCYIATCRLFLNC